MQILPEGFALPPLPYTVGLLAALSIVGWGLTRRVRTVTEREILALVPWMLAGSALHVLFVIGALPEVAEPLAGTPSVYVTVAVLAGSTWLAADAVADGDPDDAATASVPRVLGAVGTVAFFTAALSALAVGAARGSLHPLWPTIGLVAAVIVGVAAWGALVQLYPEAVVTGRVGALAVFGHALDGVSTAVGIDVLGFAERTPLSRFILELGASLPTAPLLGSGWLFVLVKVTLAAAIVALFVDYVREEPTEAFLLLALVAAVGLGPGAHNLLLFTVA
jgi:uncharacterized membrane protein